MIGKQQEYEAFVAKFKARHTSDDTFTPENVFRCVQDWAVVRYGLEGAPIVRPFWPGKDFTRADYPDGCVVIDNPPFSILAKIVGFYLARGVRFFLFAPQLTLFTKVKDPRVGYVCASCSITYDNGAIVRTGFVTNMGENVIETAPDLHRAIRAANDANVKATRKQLPKYEYPPEVLTAARAGWLSAHGEDFRVRRGDAVPVRSLDEMGRKEIFGGALMLSPRAAAERAAAERAAAERAAAERAAAERAAAERAAATAWRLSPRERILQENI